MVTTGCSFQQVNYDAAARLPDSGNYSKAAGKFERLGSYWDSSQMSQNAKAQAMAEQGSCAAASVTLNSLGDISDSAQFAQYYTDWAYYREGQALINSSPSYSEEYNESSREIKGTFKMAREAFEANPSFQDSDERASQDSQMLNNLDSVGPLSEGMLAVQKGGKWGYIDTTGTPVIPCEWDSVGLFKDRMALVERDGKYGYIDETGRIVIPVEYDSREDINFNDGYFTLLKNGHLTIRDREGNVIF